MRTARFLPLPLAVVLLSACAAPAPRGEAQYPVRIESDAPRVPLRVEVYRAWDDRFVTACASLPCSFTGREARYRVEVLGDDDVPDRTRVFDLRDPGAKMVVSPGNVVMRDVGLVTGILGPVAMAGSFFFGTLDCGTEGARPHCSTPYYAVFAGGLLFTVVGWTLFGAGKTTISEPQPMSQGSARLPALFTF